MGTYGLPIETQGDSYLCEVIVNVGCMAGPGRRALGVPPRTIRIPVTVPLLGALALSALLAVAALTTERYQRAQAERVLRDYAAFAAQSYSVRAAQQLFYVIGPALDSARSGRPRTALPAPLLDSIRAHSAEYGPQ